MRYPYIEQNFLSINDEEITKYNQKITTHLYTYKILMGASAAPEAESALESRQASADWPSTGAALTGESREVLTTVAVAKASGIKGAWEAKTSLVGTEALSIVVFLAPHHCTCPGTS